MKSYADEELKLCFLLPVDDSDEEEVKTKLVKCENCQMMIKDCEMKKHLNTHNLAKPFQCEVKGCFKKFNTMENLSLHKKYFHSKEDSNSKHLSLNQKKINDLKNKIYGICMISDDNIYNNDNDNNKEIKENQYAIGKYIYENNKGKVIDEQMFLCVEKNKKDTKENENKNDKNDRIILGYISNGLP